MDIENSHHTGLLRGDILNTYLVVIATKYGIQRSGDACVFGPSWALTITLAPPEYVYTSIPGRGARTGSTNDSACKTRESYA